MQKLVDVSVKQHLLPLNAVRSPSRTQKHGPERKDSTSHYITHTHQQSFEMLFKSPQSCSQLFDEPSQISVYATKTQWNSCETMRRKTVHLKSRQKTQLHQRRLAQTQDQFQWRHINCTTCMNVSAICVAFFLQCICLIIELLPWPVQNCTDMHNNHKAPPDPMHSPKCLKCKAFEHV